MRASFAKNRSFAVNALPSSPSGAREWLRVLLMSFAPAIALGFGRFAYALLLVPMRESQGWNYAQAGLVTSANALGYLAGALIVGSVARRWGAARTLGWSLVVVSASLALTGIPMPFAGLLVMRAIAGICGSLIFVTGAVVVIQIISSARSDSAVSVYFAGPGVGIAVSGLLIPLLLHPPLAWDWHLIWVAMGVVGLLTLALLAPTLRLTHDATPRPADTSASAPGFVMRDYVLLWPAMLSYGLYGLGYIGYMTFIIAFLQSIHVAPVLVQSFWFILGVAAASTGYIWGPMIKRLAPHRSLAALLFVLAVGALLPIVVPQVWSFVLSAILFGGSFLGAVSAITRQVRMYLPAERWTAVLGNATAIFAIGQLIGPVLTGAIADMQNGLAIGLLGSAVLLGIATLIVLVGPTPERMALRQSTSFETEMKS
nr:Major Facilitator Superfamily [uncultured bacterium]